MNDLTASKAPGRAGTGRIAVQLLQEAIVAVPVPGDPTSL